MATAFDSSALSSKICKDCSCNGFSAKVKYEVDLKAETVKFTDTSVFDSGDRLDKVTLYVADKTGKRRSTQIVIAGSSVTISITNFDFTDLTLTATVVSEAGCRANVSSYKVGQFALIGQLQHST